MKHTGSHLQQHEAIHTNLVAYVNYINKVKTNHSVYSSEEFRSLLSALGPGLFQHLDQEVQTLKGENLRLYFTLEEIKKIPL